MDYSPVEPHQHDYPVEEYSDFDEEEEEEEEDDDEGVDFENEKREQARWRMQTLEQKFTELMKLLTTKHQWNNVDEVAPDRLPLEKWKKDDLLEDSHPEAATATLAHLLAKHKDKFCQLDKADRKAMVTDLLHSLANDIYRHPGDPILNVAVRNENDDFIDCLIDCQWEDTTNLIQHWDGSGQNCLHHVFREPPSLIKRFPNKDERRKEMAAMKRRTLDRGRKLVDMAPPEAIAARDANGNTPLHCAMHYELVSSKDDAYVQLVKDMLEKGDACKSRTPSWMNNKNESPILFYRSTQHAVSERREARIRRNAEKAREKNAEAAAAAAAAVAAAAAAAAADRQQMPPPSEHMIQPSLSIRDRTRPDKERSKARGYMGDRRTPGPYEAPKVRDPSPRPNMSDKLTRPPSRSERYPTNTPGLGLSRQDVLGPPHDSKLHQPGTARKAETSGGNAPLRGHHPQTQGLKAAVGTPRAEGAEAEPTLVTILIKHFLRTRTDLEARNLMYGLNKSVKNLSFDASGHKTAADIIQMINRMSHGKFNETLAYVSIPNVTNETPKPKQSQAPPNTMNQGVSRQRQKEQDPSPGKTALVTVFRRLHREKVRCILHLAVDDIRQPSHSDAAIEMALRGRDFFGLGGGIAEPISVETWDWKKPDLSISVIAFAAPDVVNLNLYWSGNEAVLKGWSSPDWFLHHKLRRLRRLKIFATPGLETRNRIDRLLENFKENIGKLTKDRTQKLEIEYEVKASGLMKNLDLEKSESSWNPTQVREQDHHVWIEKMENFRSALHAIHEDFASERIGGLEKIKVALLDDGVDINQLTPYSGRTHESMEHTDTFKVLGLSYCESVTSIPGQGSTWGISRNGHGTIMANMILRINPWVDLYIMKMADGEDEAGRPTIHPDSAAKAIQGAIDHGADIISMSWSIKKNSQHSSPHPMRMNSDSIVGMRAGNPRAAAAPATAAEDDPIKLLEGAIGMAMEKGTTLMFCSATDDKQNNAVDFLPYQKARHYIFRIGAATAQGDRDPHTEQEDKIDYLFPGNRVAEARDPSSDVDVKKYHNGSSVGTALAAGLSSLIMYLASVMRAYYTHLGENYSKEASKFDGWLRKLKQHAHMKEAFDTIKRHDDWATKKFLPVWLMFESRTKRINNANKLKDKMEVLEELVNELCGLIPHK